MIAQGSVKVGQCTGLVQFYGIGEVNYGVIERLCKILKSTSFKLILYIRYCIYTIYILSKYSNYFTTTTKKSPPIQHGSNRSLIDFNCFITIEYGLGKSTLSAVEARSAQKCLE
jgi:hypothetical protein